MKYGRVEGIDKPVSRLVQGTLMLSTDDLEASIGFLDGIGRWDATASIPRRYTGTVRRSGCWAPGWTGAAIETMSLF